METEKIYFAIEQKLNKIFQDEPIHDKCFVHKKMVKDITKEISELYSDLLEKQRIADESKRLKSTFLKNISHEIRTPMNAIVGFSNMLNKHNITDERRKRFTEIIQESSLKLLEVIDDLVEYSTLINTKISIFNENICPAKLLEELENEFSNKFNKNIEIKFQANIERNINIQTDKNRLKNTLKRLIENAIKFTETGFISISVDIVDNLIVFKVKDTGCGISKEHQKLIFESFSQSDNSLNRNYGGLGLGLTIINENLKILNAKLDFESEKNIGTTFFVSIPYINREDNKHRYRILIAEDEEYNYFFLATLFEEIVNNVDIFHAINGQEAVNFVKNNKVDLILMDIKMPIMTGYEATKEIKSFASNIPIIAQTAYAYEKEKILASGFDDILTKPINEENLIEKIGQYIQII